MDFAGAKRIIAAFERQGVSYVVVGSMAMAAQGIVRATRDMDVFVAPDEENVARLRAALCDLFGDPAIDSITAEVLPASTRRFSTCHREATTGSTSCRA